MSMRAMLWAISQEDLTPSEKLTLIILADRHNDDTNECWPSKARLAKDTGLSEATLKRVINSLLDKGLISKVERSHPSGRQISNVYVFHLLKDAKSKITVSRSPAHDEPHDQIIMSPLEPIHKNLSKEPIQNLTREIDRKQEFWDTALGTLAALNIAEPTARGIIGRAVGLAEGDFDAVQKILDAALINPPKNVAAYVLGGLKKGAGSAPKIKMTPKMEEIEREYREKYKEYFDDTERSTGTDNRPVQPQPHAEPSNLSGASSGSPKVVSAGGSRETGGPARGYLDSLQVSADNSRSYRGSKEIDRKAV